MASRVPGVLWVHRAVRVGVCDGAVGGCVLAQQPAPRPGIAQACVVRLIGMVDSGSNLERQPFVIDGASDLFLGLWGPVTGQHARSAVGMAELLHRIPLGINGKFELHS